MMVANALISGDTPIRTDENTTIGKVVAPGPDTKLAITRSSSDKVNASNQPDTNAGAITGSVITKKVFSGVQPRSMAASSMDKSTSRNRALTTTATQALQKAVRAIQIVAIPRSTGQPINCAICTNSSNSDKPVITSGITSGAVIMLDSSVRPRIFLNRVITKAHKVPRHTAMLAE